MASPIGTRGRLAILTVVASGAFPAGGCGGGDGDESRHYSLQATRACLQARDIQAKRVNPSYASEGGDLMASARGWEAHLAFGKDAAEAKSLENKLIGEAFLFALVSSNAIVERKGNVAFYIRNGQAAPVEGCLR